MNEKRFEFYSDEDLIGVLDSVTGRTFNSFEIVDLLNELSDENNILNKNEDDLEECAIENIKLKEENEQLRDYIDTIFEDNTHICNELDIEDVQFYCERNKDYRSPSCLYQKCFNEENLVELSEKIKELFDDG